MKRNQRIKTFLAKAAVRSAAFLLCFLAAGFGIPTGVRAAENSEITEADLTVTGLTLDETDGTAYWNANNNAYKYEVRLLRDNHLQTKKTTAEHYYEFGSYFRNPGDYSFEVRAIGRNSAKGQWAASDPKFLSTSDVRDIRGHSDIFSDIYDSHHGPGVTGSSGNHPSSGVPETSAPGSTDIKTYGPATVGTATYGGNHWCQDRFGWWYQYADGTYPKNCWQCIDGLYYCFNESGYIRYGWIHWNNQWYYCGAEGALLGNTYTPDGYYVGPNGVWVP